MTVEVHDEGALFAYQSGTQVNDPIRPLHDYLIVEPLDSPLSLIVETVHKTKPLRGIVRAAGPGHYPLQYDHEEKHKRTKMWRSKRFQPNEVHIGDTVSLGGLNFRGYAFPTFLWHGKTHLICREADVVGIESPASLDQGGTAECA